MLPAIGNWILVPSSQRCNMQKGGETGKRGNLNTSAKYDGIKVLFKQHLSPAAATAAAPIQSCTLDLPDSVCS